MGDIYGQFISWESLLRRGVPALCGNAFRSLIGSLKEVPAEMCPALSPILKKYFSLELIGRSLTPYLNVSILGQWA